TTTRKARSRRRRAGSDATRSLGVAWRRAVGYGLRWDPGGARVRESEEGNRDASVRLAAGTAGPGCRGGGVRRRALREHGRCGEGQDQGQAQVVGGAGGARHAAL